MKTPLRILCASLILLSAYAVCARDVAGSAQDSITLHNFKLVGDLNGERAAFTLSATVKVENSKGGTLDLLSGPVALTELGTHPRWKIRAEQNDYLLVFDRGGEFPVQLKFNAAVHAGDEWNTVDFQI